MYDVIVVGGGLSGDLGFERWGPEPRADHEPMAASPR
jgi:hypothetical protein